MVIDLEALFPGLSGTDYRVTSPSDRKYNCIAWAASDTRRWWWPDPPPGDEGYHWPSSVSNEETLVAFMAAFATLGYRPCAVEAIEPGWERIALYATANGAPTHAARQLPDGRWTSKLGRWQDIEHTLRALEGEAYGSIVQIMKRPAP
ncbi:MAG: hypothetical protein K2R98_24430 [Gemmataceae bacterium]|nr:hypothetical protein [Gemmataceae bacterium]